MLTITNEDNMELMARYPDNYFDLAIVDPPYGLGNRLSDGGGKLKDTPMAVLYKNIFCIEYCTSVNLSPCHLSCCRH
jgi:DNA modification methylase